MPIRQEDTPSPPVRAFRIFCGPGTPDRNHADSIETVGADSDVDAADRLNSTMCVTQIPMKLKCWLFG